MADFWETIFYIALGVFILWALLKSFGIIQSPAWLEVGVPAVSGGVAIGSFYQKFRQLEKTVEEIGKKTNEVYEKCPAVKH